MALLLLDAGGLGAPEQGDLVAQGLEDLDGFVEVLGGELAD